MGYIGVISHLVTFDPNFQRDIQVGRNSIAQKMQIGKSGESLS